MHMLLIWSITNYSTHSENKTYFVAQSRKINYVEKSHTKTMSQTYRCRWNVAARHGKWLTFDPENVGITLRFTFPQKSLVLPCFNYPHRTDLAWDRLCVSYSQIVTLPKTQVGILGSVHMNINLQAICKFYEQPLSQQTVFYSQITLYMYFKVF